MLESFPSFGSLYDHRRDALVGPAAFRDLVGARASSLRKMGLVNGSRVLLKKENGLDFFADFFALWEIGACVIPLDSKMKLREMELAQKRCGAEFLLSAGEELAFAGAITPVNYQPNIGLMLLSSGSTGEPKAVMHTRDSIEKKIYLLPRFTPLSAIQNTLCLLPLHFGHGLIGNSLYPFLHGANLFLYPAFTPELCFRLGEIVDKHQITFLSSVPAIWNIAGELAPAPKGSSLRRAHCASSALTRGAWEKMKAWCPPDTEIFNVYGTTETASWVSGFKAMEYPEAGNVGKAWDAKVSLDQEGLVALESDSLTLGYCNEVDATRSALRDGKFLTGDIGRFDGEGNLIITGRTGELIHKAALKIHPGEIEEVLRSHPGVKDVCVFACPDALVGEKIAAAIEFSTPLPFPELAEWCRARLSEYKIPDLWLAVKEIPRNDRGKVNRKELLAQCRS